VAHESPASQIELRNLFSAASRESSARIIGTGRAADRQKALDFGAQ
jgi:hypothetical protein